MRTYHTPRSLSETEANMVWEFADSTIGSSDNDELNSLCEKLKLAANRLTIKHGYVRDRAAGHLTLTRHVSRGCDPGQR